MVHAAIVLLLSLYTVELKCDYKTVLLLSPPRSLSTVFLRMMYNRGDFNVFNEPSICAYCKQYCPDFAQKHCRVGAYQSFDKAKEAVLHAAQSKNVFAKEIFFSVKEYHENDHSVMQMPNVYFVFLVRNPHHVVLSLYKKNLPNIEKGIFSWSYLLDVLRYDNLYHFINLVSVHAYNKPYIIYSEELCTKPEKTIRDFCAHVGIPFDTAHLQWASLGDNFNTAQEWNSNDHKESAYYWHSDAMLSTGFAQKHTYEVDQDGYPTFSEIENEEHREQAKKFYDEQLKYYMQIKQYTNRSK